MPVQLAGQLQRLYVVTQGGKVLGDTVKGGVLAAVGNLLELAPDTFRGGHGRSVAQWLSEESIRLVRETKTTATLREGALAGLNSALLVEVLSPKCSSR